MIIIYLFIHLFIDFVHFCILLVSKILQLRSKHITLEPKGTDIQVCSSSFNEALSPTRWQ